MKTKNLRKHIKGRIPQTEVYVSYAFNNPELGVIDRYTIYGITGTSRKELQTIVNARDDENKLAELRKESALFMPATRKLRKGWYCEKCADYFPDGRPCRCEKEEMKITPKIVKRVTIEKRRKNPQ